MNLKGKVLITGISGYCGSQIAYEFLNEGYSVRGTVRDVKNTSKIKFIKDFPNHDQLEIFQLNLTSKEEVDIAVKGCDYIAHVASPAITDPTVNESLIVNPAIEGTLNILFAAYKYKVKAVVITGSVAASCYKQKKPQLINNQPFMIIDESDWSDLNGKEKIDAYPKSKTLEEMKAWDYYKTLDPEDRFRLSFINPAFVLGPFFADQPQSSGSVLLRILKRDISSIPDIVLNIVDVRDVAKCHRLAIEILEADGKRFICSSMKIHMREMCNMLRELYPELNIASKNANYCILLLLSKFISPLKFVVSSWGRRVEYNTSLIKSILKIEFMSIQQTLKDMAQCCIDKKLVNLQKKIK